MGEASKGFLEKLGNIYIFHFGKEIEFAYLGKETAQNKKILN